MRRIIAAAVFAAALCRVALGNGASYSGEELMAAASRAAKASDDGSSIVVVTASRDYAAVLTNWMVAMERLSLRNFVVVCFDSYVQSILERRGAKTCVRCQLGAVGVSRERRHKQIWTVRVEMLALLVDKYNVTLSDLDAIWLRDAHPFLHSADIVASRGSFPPWASQLWGAAACMGLIRFNAGSKDFVRTMFYRQVQANGDDQFALNLALKNDGLRWESNLSYVESSALDVGTTQTGLTIGLLPHTLFIRRCDLLDNQLRHDDHVVVRHCYTVKTAASKQYSLSTEGSWLLRDDWATIKIPHSIHRMTEKRSDEFDPHPTFSSWLRAVSSSSEKASSPKRKRRRRRSSIS